MIGQVLYAVVRVHPIITPTTGDSYYEWAGASLEILDYDGFENWKRLRTSGQIKDELETWVSNDHLSTTEKGIPYVVNYFKDLIYYQERSKLDELLTAAKTTYEESHKFQSDWNKWEASKSAARLTVNLLFTDLLKKNFTQFTNV